MEPYRKIHNQLDKNSLWLKYLIFFFLLTGSFIVLLVPELWDYEPQLEVPRPRPRQVRQPSHDPEDVALVRELAAKLMPPAKTGQVSKHDLPFPSKLVEELRALTDYKRGGYFFEVGSGDKGLFTDTLFMEQRLGWTGVLVEPDLINMKLFRRNAWIAPACLSLNNSAYEYHHQPYIRYHGHDPRGLTAAPPTVVCYPFLTFWLALNRPVIDFLSVDVGGGELEILRTLPFGRVDIKIVHVDHSKATGGFMGVTTLMQRNGFKVVSEMLPDFLMFIKKEYKDMYNEI